MAERAWSVAELAIGLEQDRVLLVDVRPADDVAAGHIPGSWPVAITALAARGRDLDDPFAHRLRAAPDPVAIVAGDPQRLAAAVALLAELGVTAIGVTGEVAAWSRQGRPLNRGPSTRA